MPGMPVHDGRNKQQMNNARIQGSADRVLRTGPYLYGIIVWMKKTLHIDDQLLRDAKSASGAKTDTDTVRLGLEALVRHGAYERLRALRGSEPHARDIRRRRERARSVKRSTA
jgi:Arc/MetJ family transcription regulator